MPDREHDVVIIGGGSGLTAAYHAEDDGLDVGLIEPGPLGGTCVNRGCIPTKTLIQSADVARTIQHAGAFDLDLDAAQMEVDFPGILERMRSMRETNVAGSDAWIEDSQAITLYRERAGFVDELTVELADSGQQLTADSVFLATGARPLIPPIDGIEETEYLTNRTILNDLEHQPEQLAIIGGGYIGLEFAHFFASLGTDVTIIESGSTLASPEDGDISARLTEAVGGYANLHLETRATRVTDKGGEVLVTGDTEAGQMVDIEAQALLVATGRRPNTEALNLEATGVQTTEEGWIDVDEHFQTSHPDVYAYGDVIGRGMFKHTSSFEGEAAYRNSQGARQRVDYDKNPHAIFTEPKVASVGLTEAQAHEREADVQVETVGYEQTAKGEIVQAQDAFAKAIVDEGSREILGFHVIGPQAPGLVHEVVVAMRAGEGTVENITDAIHVHPTLSEIVHTLFTRF